MPDTFEGTAMLDGFDPDEVAAIVSAQARDADEQAKARAHRVRTRHAMRRAASSAVLAEILPPTIEPGDSWHVISRGDVDALSYLEHAMSSVSHFDVVALSTWCMASADLEQLAKWLDAGRIESLELYVGEIFPSQYGDEYAAALRLADDYGARVVVARNHSKVILAGCAERDSWLVMEGSANVNTNPRIEQTTVTHDRSLFDFYREFFHGLRSIDRNRAA